MAITINVKPSSVHAKGNSLVLRKGVNKISVASGDAVQIVDSASQQAPADAVMTRVGDMLVVEIPSEGVRAELDGFYASDTSGKGATIDLSSFASSSETASDASFTTQALSTVTADSASGGHSAGASGGAAAAHSGLSAGWLIGGAALVAGAAAAGSSGSKSTTAAVPVPVPTPVPVPVPVPAPAPAPLAVSAITSSVATVNEGSTVVVTIATNQTSGSIAYTLTGIDATDVVGGALAGTVDIGADGKAIVQVNLAADVKTEGDETLVFTAGGKTQNITVKDTSLTPALVATLTTGIDSGAAFTGGALNDTFNATSKTLTPLDSLDGGAGTDTLNISDPDGLLNGAVPAGVTLKGIENLVLASVGNIGAAGTAYDVSGWTDVVSLSGSSMGGANLAAAATQAVSLANSGTTGALAGAITVAGGLSQAITTSAAGAVTLSGSTGAVSVTDTAVGASAITVNGGSTVSVAATGVTSTGSVTVGTTAKSTDAVTVTTDGGAVTVTGPAAAISITDTVQGANAITVNGGTSVNVTATGASTGSISVGATTASTGATVVSQAIKGSTSSSTSGGGITVKGGSTVSVTETAAQSAPTSTSTTARTTTLGAVAVTGTSTTTSVTATQSAAVAAVDYSAATGAMEVVTATFTSLAAGASVAVGGLTFTNSGSATLTAAQVAAAFANLGAGAVAGKSSLGYYTGYLKSGFTSGAVVGTAQVLFTNPSDPAKTTTFAAFQSASSGSSQSTSETTQWAAVAAAKGTGGIANNGVTVTDVNYSSGTGTKLGTITSVTANNFTSLLVKDTGLTSLTVTGGSGDITVQNDATLAVGTNPVTALTLNIGGQTAGNFNEYNNSSAKSGVLSSLTVNTTSASLLGNINSNVASLTVSGTSVLGLTSASGLSTSLLAGITVTGGASLAGNEKGTTLVDLSSLTALTSVDASGSTGGLNVKVDATKATVLGGTGADTVTSSGNVAKSVLLGGGNDTFVLGATGTSAFSAPVDGGAGTDTFSAAYAALTASGNATLIKSYVTGFESLKVTGTLGTTSLKLADFGLNSASVTVAGAVSTTATIDGLTSGNTLTISGIGSGTSAGSAYDTKNFTLTNTAWTGSANSLNVALVDVDASGVAGVNGLTTNLVFGSGSGGSATGLGTLNLSSTDGSAGAATNTVTFSDNNTALLTKVVASGSGNLLAIAAAAAGTDGKTYSASKLVTVDASAMTGSFSFSNSDATNNKSTMTITGGSGNDTIGAHGWTFNSVGTATYSAATVGDVLNGGAGNDKLYANAGADTLNGGAGNDTFVVTTAGADKLIFSTITDFGAGDTLVLKAAAATPTFVSTKVDLSALASSAVLNDAINTATGSAALGEVRWFQFSGNTYVLESGVAHSGATVGIFQDATDQIVRLTGLVDLSGAVLGRNDGTSLGVSLPAVAAGTYYGSLTLIGG